MARGGGRRWDYATKAAALWNSYGAPVEEFEIQFIDGEAIDAQLFEALVANQCNLGQFLDAVDEWDHDDKITVIIAVGEAGYAFDLRGANGLPVVAGCHLTKQESRMSKCC